MFLGAGADQLVDRCTLTDRGMISALKDKKRPGRNWIRVPSGTLLLPSLKLAKQNSGDILTGTLNLYRADVVGNHRHSVDHAGLLVLADGVGSSLTHLEQAIGSIAAHAGHNDAGHFAFDLFGHGEKQSVYRGAVAAYLLTWGTADGIPGSRADNPHLIIGRGQQSQIGRASCRERV